MAFAAVATALSAFAGMIAGVGTCRFASAECSMALAIASAGMPRNSTPRSASLGSTSIIDEG
jgi:hypothetical protein